MAAAAAKVGRILLALLFVAFVRFIDTRTTLTCRTSMYISSVRDSYASPLVRWYLDFWILGFGSLSSVVLSTISSLLCFDIISGGDQYHLNASFLVVLVFMPATKHLIASYGYLGFQKNGEELWIVTLDENLSPKQTMQEVCSAMKTSVVLRWYPITKTYLAYMSVEEAKRKETGVASYMAKWNDGK